MYSVLIFCPVPKISNSLTFFNFNTIDLTQRKMCAEAMSILTATDDNERVDAGRTPSFIHANSHQHARLFVELTKKIGICGSLFITTMRILVFSCHVPDEAPDIHSVPVSEASTSIKSYRISSSRKHFPSYKS
jgi:hypothetical protein